MNRVIDLRLRKPEACRQVTVDRDLTYDEFALCKNWDPTLASAAATMEEIKSDMVAAAQRLCDPDYQRWLQRNFGSSRITAVTCGSWYGTGETTTVQSILKETGLAALN